MQFSFEICCRWKQVTARANISLSARYRQCSPTDQCVFVLKELIDSYRMLNGNVFTRFLDASKGFDVDDLSVKLNYCHVGCYYSGGCINHPMYADDLVSMSLFLHLE